jgi:hypothetical protein
MVIGTPLTIDNCFHYISKYQFPWPNPESNPGNYQTGDEFANHYIV